MKSLVSFAGSSLSRTEMKNVKGGACWSYTASGTFGGPHSSADSASKTAGAGGRWCCTDCKTASWWPK